ncbi:MAG TPA: MmcQ-like protein [Cryomorphaceae bacterium]|nr:MmcQ-like protein [Owenweeksia sp.]MBF98303.1 MmcQ-like protein [Owenweeksia sp.]HAD96748.1 MmcQ-like protein [Cryomorphaceae bacterium]HBF21225.1 MmcQ-like protein [Cryomorphaceae bacterium]HCQ16203.1 MmcQ-like protein [Cryomorphaceae bacterium]
MNIEELRLYCLGKPGTTESTPFGEDTLVFKVAGKMFALTSLSSADFSVNLKCNPEKVPELREQYPQVQPGYHMNKKHWNTVIIDGGLTDHLIREWIDHSYDLVVAGLSGKLRDQLNSEV